MSLRKSSAVALGLMAAPMAPANKPPPPPSDYVVHLAQTPDEKAVFATIETANVVPARVRAGGTVAELKVRQGDHVEQGQVIALVGDPKRAMQVHASAAQAQAAQAQLAQARAGREVELQIFSPLLNLLAQQVFVGVHACSALSLASLG